ncbi:MAG: nucleoside phosphorylase, partial [Cyclobacteriaceae bacterium]
MSNIIIHQAFYGEVNKAHSKIHQTIDDSELTSFLIRFTDRPGSLTPGVTLKPYLSGSAFKKYYVFTKTFPDPQASRSGMVLTNVLITEVALLNDLNDLKSILHLFISEIPIERTNLEPIVLKIEHAEQTFEDRQPIFIQKSLSSFIKGDLPILFTGDIGSFESILNKLWNSPINAFREQLKFRASFSPKDIETSDDLTIVFIQSELLARWNASSLISGEENDLIEITSPTEALFLGEQIENPFYEFLKNIGANLDDLNTYTQGDILYADYIDLDKLNDPDLLRRDLRILAKLSPKKNLGNTIKSKFLKKYNELINNGLETNIKGLRNVPWVSFNQGDENGENLVNAIINKAFSDPQFRHIEMLSEVSAIAINEKDKTWWHKTIVNTFKLNISKTEETIQKSIWKLLLFSKDCSNTILSIIPSLKGSEAILVQHLPKEVPTEMGKSILLEAQKRKWYLLYAEILLKLFKPEEAVKKQLTFEHPLSFEDSIGMSLILKEIADNGVLAITLDSCKEKLILELTKRIIKNESLLKSLDLQVSCWLNIWTAVLNEKQVFNYGIKGKEQAIVFSVFDLILQGKKVDDIVFEHISNTTYSNISDYTSRNEVWDYIPISSRDKFIEATADTILERLLKDEIDGASIEQILIDRLTSALYMTSFLNENRNNMEPVLKVFESFSNLPEKFLSDYIYYYSSQITENKSYRLGTIILNRNFTTTAQKVYDKSRYYVSFTLAYETCKSLVRLSWWESLRPSPIQPSTSQYQTMKQPKESNLNAIESLPTIVILTAIQEEYDAVKLFLKEVVEVDQDDTTYEAGIFSLYEQDIAKVIIRECGAKNTIAAQETERAIRNFKPSAIFFAGIAGSRKPNDFSLGDVIFPKVIYSYEAGKSDTNSFVARPDLASTTYTLMEIAKKERRKEDWKSLIKNGWNQVVKADLGIIASGEQIIEHYESEIGNILTKHYNDTSVVEMEGFGFAKAAMRQGRGNSQMMIGIVRGISDIIGQPSKKKMEEEDTDRRPENAKQLASDTAAAFTYWLIF